MFDELSTKIISSHVDRGYIRRWHQMRRWRFACTMSAFAIAAIWSVIYGLPTRSRVHDPGPLSAAHQMWQNDCTRCHDGGSGVSTGAATQPSRSFSLAVSDNAC